jgi:ubiquinone/menaquinone biosynthesis C-methylase UbiE
MPKYDVKADYALGRSEAEANRLIIQAEVLRPFTERLMRDVGLAPGMRVLDLGCGTGDVSILVAKIVGKSGAVVGIDHDANILATARKRAEEAGLENISFQEAAVESFQGPQSFDVVTGRCVAFFAEDPASYLRAAAKAVRPGGKLALQEPNPRWLELREPNSPNGQFSAPRIADFERVGEAFARALTAAAPSHDVALRMAEHFAKAGLPEPHLSWDITVGSGPDTPLYGLAAACFHSMFPQMAKHGINGFEDLATDMLEDRLRTQAVQSHSQVSFYTLVSAWAEL